MVFCRRPLASFEGAAAAWTFGRVMKKSEVLHAWASILAGRAPSLSIEITKECPLRCPGCYAFDAAHLGGSRLLRQLSDFKGEELVARVLAVVDEHKPLHVSLVGGDVPAWLVLPALEVTRERVVATYQRVWGAAAPEGLVALAK